MTRDEIHNHEDSHNDVILPYRHDDLARRRMIFGVLMLAGLVMTNHLTQMPLECLYEDQMQLTGKLAHKSFLLKTW